MPAPNLKTTPWSVLRGLLVRGGVDRPIAYAVLARSMSVITAPVSLLLMARFLTKEEQGYFFTFGSVVAMTTVFELGLSYVLLVNASHERSRLEWSGGLIVGDPIAKARLASMIRRSLQWYGAIALVIVAALLPVGFYFFGAHTASAPGVAWRAAWTAVAIVCAATMVLTPIWAVLEGCGLVAEVEFVRMLQQLAAVGALWIALSAEGHLLSSPASAGASLAVGVGWLVLKRRRTVVDLLRFRHAGATVHWITEVWPMQWRIGISAFAGWFIFQVFNPVLFSYQGPVIAGQMGMTLSLSQALVMIGSAWVNTKAPLFGQLVARAEYATLDRVFFRAMRQSCALVVAGGVAVVLGLVGLRGLGLPLAQRLLPPLPAAALMGVAAVNSIVFAEGLYLRAHKREPFLGISVGLGIATAISTVLLARTASASAVAFSYFALSLIIGLGGGTYVFVLKRREWHAVPPPPGSRVSAADS